MQFCTRCGRPRDEAARFCVNCGNQFPDPQPVTQEAPAFPPSAPAWDEPASDPTGPIPAAPVGWGAEPTQQLPPQGPPFQGPPPPAPPGWGPGVRDGGTPYPPYEPPPHERPPYGLDAIMGPGAPNETLAGPGGDGGPRRRSPWALVTMLLVIVLAGGGTAAALVLTGHHGANHPQAGGSTKPPASPTSTPPTPTQTPTTASPSPTNIPGLLPMAPGVAQNPRNQAIAAMLDRYFSAINHRNYFAYYALLSPQQQQQISQSQFNKGFATTRDSSETLQSVSPGPGGTTVATVTFTSHQNPADSVDGHQSCTRWQISLYLQHGGNGYVISKPPSSYRASYAAC